MQIMNRKTTTLRTIHVHVVLNGVICLQILYDVLFYMLVTYYLSSFFPKWEEYFNKVCFELPQNVTWSDNYNVRDEH